MLERLASACFRHRWRVVALWAVGLVGLFALSGALGGAFSDSGRLEGTDSQRAYDLLGDEMPERSGESATVVFHDPAGHRPPRGPGGHRRVPRRRPDPAPGGVRQLTGGLGGPDRRRSVRRLRRGRLHARRRRCPWRRRPRRWPRRRPPSSRPASRSRSAATCSRRSRCRPARCVGLLAAVVILLVAFGSVVAMGLPIVTALVGVAASIAALGLWAAVVPTPDFTTQVAMMIGLGVGIDYALFIVTRYRAALRRGLDPHAATVEAMGTAGRAVRVRRLHGDDLAARPAADGPQLPPRSGRSARRRPSLVAVAAAVTLLPALLGLRRPAHRSTSACTAGAAATGPGETLAHRWARRRPAPPGPSPPSAAPPVLLALAAPVVVHAPGRGRRRQRPGRLHHPPGLRPAGRGLRRRRQRPADRRAGDARRRRRGRRARCARRRAPRRPASCMVTAVREPARRAPSPSPRPSPPTAPQSERTEQLVRHLRDDVLPAAAAGSGLAAHVGGQTASGIDFAQVLSAAAAVVHRRRARCSASCCCSSCSGRCSCRSRPW